VRNTMGVAHNRTETINMVLNQAIAPPPQY
jgi:hypothetical protein